MARPLRLLWVWTLVLPSLARAEPQIVILHTVTDVSVTVYRDPYRTGWSGPTPRSTASIVSA